MLHMYIFFAEMTPRHVNKRCNLGTNTALIGPRPSSTCRRDARRFNWSGKHVILKNLSGNMKPCDTTIMSFI